MLLKIISIFLIVGMILVVAASQVENSYVLLEFNYDNGNFSLISKSLESGNYPYSPIERTYGINLLSDSGNLYSASFDPTLLYTDYGNETLEGGLLILNETTFYISVPNFEDIQDIQIVKDNIIVFEGDIHDVGATNCRIA